MPSSTFIRYFSQSLKTCHARPLLSASSRTQARFFSERPTSPKGQERENAYTRDASSDTGEDTGGKEKIDRSTHAQWYGETLPAMIPIALLGSAVYIGLQLVQTKLATEKYLDEANARIALLEEEIVRLQSEQEARNKALSGRRVDGGNAQRATSRWWWLA